MEAIEASGAGIVLLVDAERRLVGTITDGDVRRAILRGVNLGAPATALLENRLVGYGRPAAASAASDRSEFVRLMRSREIRHVPLLNEGGRVVEHDCSLRNHIHVASGALLAGGVSVGDGTFVGMGARVRQYVRIGANVTVGAGCVVLEDVPDEVIVVGAPARIIRGKEASDE